MISIECYTCQHRASSFIPSDHTPIQKHGVVCQFKTNVQACSIAAILRANINLRITSPFLLSCHISKISNTTERNEKLNEVRKMPISAITASARLKNPFSSLFTCHTLKICQPFKKNNTVLRLNSLRKSMSWLSLLFACGLILGAQYKNHEMEQPPQHNILFEI